jgi:hypothetical protein
MRKVLLLISALVLLFCTTAVSHARVKRGDVVPARRADLQAAFEEFDRLLPMVKSGDDKDAQEVTEALEKGKSPFMVMAAVEAVRQADVDKPGSGKPYLPKVLALMGEDFKKLHKEEIFTVNVLACIGRLAKGDDDAAIQVVKTLLAWQRWSENQVVRLRNMAERALLDVTGEDCAFSADTLTFWEWWVRAKETKQDPKNADKPPEKRSKTAPVIFKEPMVGTRVVFVIDVSDSMKWPIDGDDLKKLKEKAPDLNWASMPDNPSPMDVAKAELVRSIDKLRPTPKPGKHKKKKHHTRTNSKDDPEARTFAIITYSTEAKMMSKGWVNATDSNCDDWMGRVDELETENLTNIHGALLKSYGLSDKGVKTDDIELDRECVLSGAHTIVFLTDGYPTWSEDSESQNQPDRWKRENQVGDGEYVKDDKLIELLKNLNRFRKVVVNTVGIGNHDKDLMKAFAKETSGAYTDWFCKVVYK